MKIRIAYFTSGEIIECHDWPQAAFKKRVKEICADSHCKVFFRYTPRFLSAWQEWENRR